MARKGSLRGTGYSQLSLPFNTTEPVSQAPRRRVRCKQCRKPFLLNTWYEEQGLKLFFCGSACKKDWERESGERRLQVRLTGRPKRRGGDWDAIVERVRDRDGHRCRACGITEEALKRRLDVHHCVPVRLFASTVEANRMDNLIALCPSCHMKQEEDGRKSLPLFGSVTHRGQSDMLSPGSTG